MALKNKDLKGETAPQKREIEPKKPERGRGRSRSRDRERQTARRDISERGNRYAGKREYACEEWDYRKAKDSVVWKDYHAGRNYYTPREEDHRKAQSTHA